jgi:hypothetical protein
VTSPLQPQDRPPSLAERGGIAVFRVWMPIAAVGAALVALLYWGLYLQHTKSLNAAASVYGNLWMAYAAAESVCLFRDWRRRVIWMALGGVAGVLSQVTPPDYYWPVLGLMMAGVCFRVRRCPWVWILVMPVLHVSFHTWSNEVYGWAGMLHTAVSSALPQGVAIPRRIFGVTAWLFIFFLVRALVGSFLTTPFCSKKVPEEN